MSLIPYQRNRSSLDLFGGLSQLYHELDRMFDPSSHGLAMSRGLGLLEGAWSPAVDVIDEKDHLRVKAELPGLKKDEIDVTVQGDTLILRGERKQEFDEKKKNYHRVERFYGQFHRAISLPSPVEAGQVKASYKDGVLEVVLPKKAEAKPRQIAVEVK